MKLVTIERSFIDTFAQQWPGFSLPSVTHIEALFDPADDLVDFSLYYNDEDVTDRFVDDEIDGLVWLLNDARDNGRLLEVDRGPGMIGPNHYIAEYP